MLVDDFFMHRVKHRYDFVGVNFYFSVRLRGYKMDDPVDELLSDVGWGLHPYHLQHILKRVHKKCKKPIIVTESGLADDRDEHRRWWISENLKALIAARQQGVDVVGYLYWSLIDNFEWAYGRWPNFGLVHIDYNTYKRTLRPSARWFAKVLKKLRDKEN
jgi:beta-glucosidase/6-phospho-beta-glucosidase/beta-galactosidase